MFKNIFTIARRSLLQNWVYTTINVLGLSVGVAVFLAVFSIVRYEYRFNADHPDSDQIFRVYSKFAGAIDGTNRGVPSAVIPFIEEEVAVNAAVVPFKVLGAEVTIDLPDGDLKRLGRQRQMIVASSGYFDLVNHHKWLAGSKEVLDEPLNVVLTQSQAEKYFGPLAATDMLGLTVNYNDSLRMTVGGIIEDLSYSDFYFTDLISEPTKDLSWLKSRFNNLYWSGVNSGTQLFVKFEKGFTASDQANLLAVLNDKIASETSEQDWRITLDLQPLADLHFNNDLEIFDGSDYVAQKKILNTILLVAFVILLIACINFVNIMTAFAANRSLEIGVRKVMGSSRRLLIAQFLFESFLVTCIAVLLAVPLVNLLINAFDAYIPGNVTFNVFELETLSFLALTVLIVGLLSGLYPAFVLSSIDSGKALKKQTGYFFKNRSSQRKVLTTTQFALAQILVIASTVAYLQVQFMLDKDLGLTKDSMFYFYTSYYDDESKQQVFKNKLEQVTAITETVSFSSPPVQQGYSLNRYKGQSGFGETHELESYIKRGGTGYLDFFGIELQEGEEFKPEDESEIVVNEAFAKEMGYDNRYNDLIGQTIFNAHDTFKVSGVFKDFHFQSLHSKIKPLMISYTEGNGIAIKFQHSSDVESIRAEVESLYHEVYPNREFESFFTENTQQDFYEEEQMMADLSIFATMVAILISCLGLFGLASYTTVRRTKEIGIRKVLGASILSIIRLLSSQFLRLVVIAYILAIPVAYYLSTTWLADFEYRIALTPWTFIMAGVLTLLLAVLTVSYQSIKTGSVNPAESLKHE